MIRGDLIKTYNKLKSHESFDWYLNLQLTESHIKTTTSNSKRLNETFFHQRFCKDFVILSMKETSFFSIEQHGTEMNSPTRTLILI